MRRARAIGFSPPRLATAAMLALAVLTTATSVSAATLDDCEKGDPFRRLDACNSIINDDKVDAVTRAKALVAHAYTSYGIYGETDGPMANFSAATLLDPKNARAHIGLGAMHLIRKEYDQAEAEFKAALQIEPDMALAWTYLGSLANTRGDTKAAMANYDKALSIDKRQPLANLGKADLLVKAGRKGEALALYRFVLYLFPPVSRQHAFAQQRIKQLETELKKQ